MGQQSQMGLLVVHQFVHHKPGFQHRLVVGFAIITDQKTLALQPLQQPLQQGRLLFGGTQGKAAPPPGLVARTRARPTRNATLLASWNSPVASTSRNRASSRWKPARRGSFSHCAPVTTDGPSTTSTGLGEYGQGRCVQRPHQPQTSIRSCHRLARQQRAIRRGRSPTNRQRPRLQDRDEAPPSDPQNCHRPPSPPRRCPLCRLPSGASSVPARGRSFGNHHAPEAEPAPHLCHFPTRASPPERGQCRQDSPRSQLQPLISSKVCANSSVYNV